MKKSTIALISVIAVLVIIALSFIGIKNDLVTKEEAVSQKYADLDSTLQRRADLIPNLVNTVKGYVAHENEVIDKITTARQNLINANSIDEQQKANDELTNSLNALMVVVENYPDLKSSENFRGLQDELAGSENRINTARIDYNNAVKNYNSSIKKFPGSVIAGMSGLSEKKYFEADVKAKEVPSVSFE